MLSSFLAFVVFGAKKGLLVYRMDVRCQNRPPMVRDAFSKALRAKNRLLWYGRDIRYQTPPSYGTRRIFGARILFSTIHFDTLILRYKGPRAL